MVDWAAPPEYTGGYVYGPVAQGLEHVAYNDAVGGSIPPWPTYGIFTKSYHFNRHRC